jgi:hypothetical protein
MSGDPTTLTYTNTASFCNGLATNGGTFIYGTSENSSNAISNVGVEGWGSSIGLNGSSFTAGVLGGVGDDPLDTTGTNQIFWAFDANMSLTRVSGSIAQMEGVHVTSPFNEVLGAGPAAEQVAALYGVHILDMLDKGTTTAALRIDNQTAGGLGISVGNAPSVFGGAVTLGAITGSNQCVQVNSVGLTTGTGLPCGSFAGIIGGTNTTAAMVVGSGATLAPAGVGAGVITSNGTLTTIVSGLPTVGTSTGQTYVVTDMLNPGSCTTGGGSIVGQCRSNGSAWVLISGSGGGGSPGGANLSTQYNNGGVLGGIPVPTSPNGVFHFYGSTPSGGVGQISQYLSPGISTRSVSASADTILVSDVAQQVSYSYSGTVQVCIPAPSQTNFANWIMQSKAAAGTTVVYTIKNAACSAGSGLINGGASYTQSPSTICKISTSDNTNLDVTCPAAASVTTSGSPAASELSCFSAASQITNCNLSGVVTTTNTGVTSFGANVVGNAALAVVQTRRVCDIAIGDESSSNVITNSQLGPQKRMCFIPAAATIVELDVAADGGTPNVLVAKNHAGTDTNLTSAALATAASGGIACANTAGSGTGIDGATTCSVALATTSLAAGDYLELVSGTAGGTAKLMTIHVTYTIN